MKTLDDMMSTLKWQDKTFNTPAGGKIPYREAVLARWTTTYETGTQGTLTVTLMIYVYPKTIQVRMKIVNVNPDGTDPEYPEDDIPEVTHYSWQPVYKGTRSDLERNFEELVKEFQIALTVTSRSKLPVRAVVLSSHRFFGWQS